MRIIICVAIILAATLPLQAQTQNIPNPVQVSYGGFRQQPERVYNVDCWSSAGVRGSWLPISESTYTSQEALIYLPPPTQSQSLRGSILYCLDAQGNPGTISGAPNGLVLPPNSQVRVYNTAEISITHKEAGKNFAISKSTLIDNDTRIDAGPNGVVVRRQHLIEVYPSGTRLSIGGGHQGGFIRPGTPSPKPSPQVTGCTISYYNDHNEIVKTQQLQTDCPLVPPANLHL